MQNIIDISHHNGKIDFDELKAAGVEAIFMKATNGANNTDNLFKQNSSEARRVGIKVGAYHFMLSQQDPDAQANNFLSNKGMIDLLPVIDMEWDFKNNTDMWKLVTVNARVAMLGRFITAIKAELRVSPIIYTNANWYRLMFGGNNSYKDIIFSDCPLWLADYSTTPDEKLNLANWKSWTLRQYSEKGKVDGISTFVDLNRLNSGKTLTDISYTFK